MTRVWKLNAICAAAVLGAFIAPANAQTAPTAVSLESEAMIERSTLGADGSERTELKNPGDVIIVPGDRVVFTLTYRNKGAEAATGFRATNPMPGPVQFVAAAEDWAEVSVDGGKSWGKLSALTVPVKGADGVETTRAAGTQDVTHVRWVFANPIAPGSQGSISYRGIIK